MVGGDLLSPLGPTMAPPSGRVNTHYFEREYVALARRRSDGAGTGASTIGQCANAAKEMVREVV